MAEVNIRDLRNHGGDVIDRLVGGERITITRAGKPVAELRPLPGPALSAEALLHRWHRLPPVDPIVLRADLDEILEAAL
jgi:prevent-host-death family protein